jgi:hypothetical protein
MRPRITALAVGAIAALAVIAAPASAAGGAVRITLDVNFETGVEAFTADGAFCATGTAETTDNWSTGFGRAGRAGVFHVTKVFTCENGADSITVDLDAALIGFKGGTIGGWRVVDGTGAYAGASGGGQIVGSGTSYGIVDTYSGILNR